MVSLRPLSYFLPCLRTGRCRTASLSSSVSAAIALHDVVGASGTIRADFNLLFFSTQVAPRRLRARMVRVFLLTYKCVSCGNLTPNLFSTSALQHGQDLLQARCLCDGRAGGSGRGSVLRSMRGSLTPTPTPTPIPIPY